MSEKWTPGQWSVWDGIQTRGVLTVAQSPNCVVADMWHPPVGTAEANAHLIAAAPDMYRELDMQVRNCPVCKGEGYAVDVLDILTKDAPEKTPCNRCKSARAALSRARGEQP